MPRVLVHVHSVVICDLTVAIWLKSRPASCGGDSCRHVEGAQLVIPLFRDQAFVRNPLARPLRSWKDGVPRSNVCTAFQQIHS